ncbi:MAG: DEAD/DEAH box helicase family protein, partial [Gemmatimonadaceae bacterium]|nr:DEAD/DEAH box helicase family protein [Gemmatimonadaceae bacterium]
MRAANVELARVTFPEARVVARAHDGAGTYEAPIAPRTLRRLEELGEEVPADIQAACDEHVRQMRQIETLRGRLFDGALPSMDRFLAPGTTLRRVQTVGAAIALSTDRSALFMDMGTGKTLAALVACARRFEAHGLRRVLVIAPATVAGGWAADIERLAMRDQVEFVHASGSQARRRRQYNRARLVGGGDDMMAIVAISYGSLANDAQAIVERFDPQAVIVDESHYVKNL